jgi:hypothetical protein
MFVTYLCVQWRGLASRCGWSGALCKWYDVQWRGLASRCGWSGALCKWYDVQKCKYVNGCESWGVYSGVGEGSGLLGAWCPTFERNMTPSSSRFQGEGRGPFTLEPEDDIFLLHVWHHLPNDENHILEDWNPGKWMYVGSFIHPSHCHMHNVTIPCRSQQVLPFLSVIYSFLPPFSNYYSSILSDFILQSISWSTSQTYNSKFIYNTLLGILLSSILSTCPNNCNLFNLFVSLFVGRIVIA